MRRWLLLATSTLALGLLAGEAISRYYLGLGDPPLTIRDAEMEYAFAPNQDVVRFGNRITYNAFSMRSRPIEPRKDDPRELRVLVLGDSVVNGGALTDQRELATTLAEAWLTRPDRPAFVGNVSAGSWGPENLLAWTERYGWLGADVVIVVLSTHDIADVRDFAADLGPDAPMAKPTSALWEAVTRYLPRYLAFPASDPPRSAVPADRLVRGRAALVGLLDAARRSGARVIVLHHPERDEAEEPPDPLRAVLVETVLSAGVPLVPLAPLFGPVGERSKAYRDAIHINEKGQEILARLIVCLVDLDPGEDPMKCVGPTWSKGTKELRANR